jgi:hypothetical protein
MWAGEEDMDKRAVCLSVLALAVFCLVVFGLATAPVSAQTTATWSDATGNWTTASDWNCPSSGVHCIPNNTSGTSYDVLINTAGSDVMLDGSSTLTGTTISTLSIGSAVNLPDSLQIADGESLNVTGNATGIGPYDHLSVDDIGPGGSSLHVGGNLTNSGEVVWYYGQEQTYVTGMQIGNPNMTAGSTVTVAGTFTGAAQIFGGRSPGSQALLNVGQAAPSTLTDTLYLQGDTGGAAVEYGSGGIVQIGDGSTNPGRLTLVGPSAYLELSSALGSNSALANLATIANNGSLDLEGGASLATGPLTNNGSIDVDTTSSLPNGYGGPVRNPGHSSLHVTGNLTGDGALEIGNGNTTSPSTITVAGAFTDTSSIRLQGGSTAGAQALLDLAGAAPGVLTGSFFVSGSTGGAAVEYGAGGITQLGDGSNNAGNLTLVGAKAYLELSSATGSNSALATLSSIATNGSLDLENGASLSTAVPLTNDGSININTNNINLNPGYSTAVLAPSTLSVGGDLTNGSYITLGEQYGSGALTVNGNLTNTSNGFLNLQSGQLSVSKNVSNSGEVTVHGVEVSQQGATLTVGSGGTYTQTAGTTDVNGTLIAPTVDIAGGSLLGRGTIAGNVINDSIVLPGHINLSDLRLKIDGNYTQGADGRLVINFVDNLFVPGLNITGQASLDGTLYVDFIRIVPGPNTDFPILKAGSITGDFTTVNIVGITCPTCFFDPSTGTLDMGSSPSGTPEPGSLILFGTGLLGMACLLRRKLRLVVRDWPRIPSSSLPLR